MNLSGGWVNLPLEVLVTGGGFTLDSGGGLTLVPGCLTTGVSVGGWSGVVGGPAGIRRLTTGAALAGGGCIGDPRSGGGGVLRPGLYLGGLLTGLSTGGLEYTGLRGPCGGTCGPWGVLIGVVGTLTGLARLTGVLWMTG